MLLIDGVKYEEWEPPDEDAFELVVVEHAKDVFGENTQYFNIKKRLESFFGKSRIPDGYVIEFTDPPQWHVVEIELSDHPMDTHIREQVNDFITATQKIITENRQKIIDEIFKAINNNNELRRKIENLNKSQEIYWFLRNLILDKDPCLTIVIERKTDNIEEYLKAALRYNPLNIIEFRTFIQDNVDGSHAHLFSPINPIIDTHATGKNEFLYELREKFITLRPNLKPQKPTNRYFKISTGHSKIHLELLLWGDNGIGIEVHLERDTRIENDKILEKLKQYEKTLESNIGESLVFQSKWEKRWSRIYTYKEKLDSPELKQWAIDTMSKFYDNFKPLLDKIES